MAAIAGRLGGTDHDDDAICSRAEDILYNKFIHLNN